MAKPYKYTGILAQPMDNQLWLIADRTKNPADRAIALAAERKQLEERLHALELDCKVPPGADPIYSMFTELTLRHVPGFQNYRLARRSSAAKKGRPRKFMFDYKPMAALVDERVGKGSGVSQAVRAVARQLGQKGKEATVERDYRRFKKWEAERKARLALVGKNSTSASS